MPRKTLKKQRKQRGGGGFNINLFDKEKNREPISEKTKALKELISQIELSLVNNERANTKFKNKFFNPYNNDWFERNLVTEKQMNDYLTSMKTLKEDPPPEEYSQQQQQDINKFGYMLIEYLKQIYILITGSAKGSVFDDEKNNNKILFPQEIDYENDFSESNSEINLSDFNYDEKDLSKLDYATYLSNLNYEKDLPESSTFIVSEKYKEKLTQKFGLNKFTGDELLDKFKANYDMVRKFINSKIKPELVPSEDEFQDDLDAYNMKRKYFDSLKQKGIKSINFGTGKPKYNDAQGTSSNNTEQGTPSDNTEYQGKDESLGGGGTRKKQIRKKPHKNKTGKKQYK